MAPYHYIINNHYLIGAISLVPYHCTVSVITTSSVPYHFTIVPYHYMYVIVSFVVLMDLRNILLLSDVDFISSMANYFKNIFKDIEMPSLKRSSGEKSDEGTKPTDKDLVKKQKSKPLNLPNIKVDVNVRSLRVAIIEDVESSNPQALVLKVLLHYLLSLFSLLPPSLPP